MRRFRISGVAYNRHLRPWWNKIELAQIAQPLKWMYGCNYSDRLWHLLGNFQPNGTRLKGPNKLLRRSATLLQLRPFPPGSYLLLQHTNFTKISLQLFLVFARSGRSWVLISDAHLVCSVSRACTRTVAAALATKGWKALEKACSFITSTRSKSSLGAWPKSCYAFCT